MTGNKFLKCRLIGWSVVECLWCKLEGKRLYFWFSVSVDVCDIAFLRNSCYTCNCCFILGCTNFFLFLRFAEWCTQGWFNLPISAMMFCPYNEYQANLYRLLAFSYLLRETGIWVVWRVEWIWIILCISQTNNLILFVYFHSIRYPPFKNGNLRTISFFNGSGRQPRSSSCVIQ